jgi:hypothetical protein
MKNYTIKIKYRNGETESINIKSNNIEWSMDQYQRNREPLKWEVIKEEQLND